MQISDLTAEQARELANPGVWTVQALIDKLPHVHPWWMRDAVNNSCENRAELERRIVALMDTQANELSRLYMGLVMFFLSHPRGREAFLAGLRSGDAVLRKLVLDQFRIFRDDDLGCDGAPGKLPASCEEVLSAIVPLLQEPVSYQGGLALDFALRPQIFNLSLAHTRPLLAHDDQAVRNKVALAYLHHGRDDGALDTLATGLFAPGVVLNDQTKAWPTGRQGACYALKSCAEHAGDPDIRLRAGVLALQVLHGLTFGGTYLGNQHAIVRVVPEEMTASAQGLYGSLSAILLAGSTALAGPLYESFGAKAFLAMTVSPVLALAIVAGYAYLSPRGPARQE